MVILSKTGKVPAGRGRPKLQRQQLKDPEEQYRQRSISITDKDWNLLKREADDLSIPISQLIRLKLLKYQVRKVEFEDSTF
jgi:hypothetical protein